MHGLSKDEGKKLLELEQKGKLFDRWLNAIVEIGEMIYENTTIS
mgnify:CR=1 FL=1